MMSHHPFFLSGTASYFPIISLDLQFSWEKILLIVSSVQEENNKGENV